MKKKILIAQFHHETNSFCPALADETAYRNYRFDVGADVFSRQRGLGTEIGAFLDIFEAREDIELIPAVALNAAPSGPVTAEVYDFVAREIKARILEHAPLDGVLLTLHGAMVAQGHPDGEGDLLEMIRKLVGDHIPVIASLDLHANVTPKMAQMATALIPYEQYPHTDTYETGYAAAQLMLDTITGKVKPVMAYRYIPHLLPLLPCEEPQIKPLYELTEQLSHTRGVCSVRFAHGFFMADIAQMGMSVMVVTDGDKTLAEQLADRLESAIVAQLPELKRTDMSLEAALKRIDSSSNQPIVLADASDNPGAGAFSDTTHILRRILERGMTGAALATIVDPDSVEKCIAAGVGTTVDLDLGGWSDAARSGGPLQVTAYVKKITDGKYACKEKLSYGEIINHGKTAVVEIAGNLVLITSVPRQPWDSEVFRSHGITPEDQKLLIVKSAVHFRESYGKFSREMITVALPGYAVPTPDAYVFQNWKGEKMSEIDLSTSIQINNGLKQTCADGAALAFDSKYGIMFCAYMPGYHGDYGESRGKIALSYFPASQPTNAKHIDIVQGNDVYIPNILGLGDGKVRIFYEKNSRAEGDHTTCYKDFDFLSGNLSEERIVMVKNADGTTEPLCLSVEFKYLEAHGYYEHKYIKTEQAGHSTFFRGEDGYTYGAALSEYAEAILFRSDNNLETVEFFAVYPRAVQYEFDYKFLNGKLYAIYRTPQKPGTSFSFSEDGGITWSEPVALENSIQCRPRMIISGNSVIMGYNYFNDDYGNRPRVIMGRTAIRLATVNERDEVVVLHDLHSKYGIVNIALTDILGDVYMAYSTSELALEYQNGTPYVRGKDAIRYIKLGELLT